MSPHISLRAIALAALILSAPAQGAVLVSDFNSLAAQLVGNMEGSWIFGSTDQYVQDTGFVSITSVGGGNPAGDGYFTGSFAGGAVDLSGLTQVSLAARIDLNNASTNVTITFFDSTFTAVASSTFLSSNFTSSFSTLQSALTTSPEGGNVADVTYWQVSGDTFAGNDFRYSFDSLSVVAVPEPATTGLLILGGLSVAAVARRRLKRS